MITKEQALAAQKVLADNGIDDTGIVLQALGYILADEEWEDFIDWDMKGE